MTCVCCVVTSWPCTASRELLRAPAKVGGCWPWHEHGPGTCPRALTLGQGSHMATAQGLGYSSWTQGFKGRHPRWQQRRQQLCAPPRSALGHPSLCSSVCTEAGPVPLSLFSLQLFWKAKFHQPVVLSHLLPTLHTYLPTSLHIDLPTHFSFFPYVVPNGWIPSSLGTIQVKEFPDIYTTGLSGRKALPTHRRLAEACKVGLFNLGPVGMLLEHQ